MRKVVTGAFVSMDGVMQAPGGPQEDPAGGFAFGGWVVPYADEVFGEEVDRLFRDPFDLLLGRRTYDIFAAHWPYAEGGPDDSIAVAFNKVTKYVATRSQDALGWAGSVVLKDAARDVAKLRQDEGPRLVTQGSADLIQTLLRHDLIDELAVFTFPILLGGGKKLFGPGTQPAAFALTSSRTSPNGIVITTYVRKGKVETGDYAMDPPTQAELDRRRRLAGET